MPSDRVSLTSQPLFILGCVCEGVECWVLRPACLTRTTNTYYSRVVPGKIRFIPSNRVTKENFPTASTNSLTQDVQAPPSCCSERATSLLPSVSEQVPICFLLYSFHTVSLACPGAVQDDVDSRGHRLEGYSAEICEGDEGEGWSDSLKRPSSKSRVLVGEHSHSSEIS